MRGGLGVESCKYGVEWVLRRQHQDGKSLPGLRGEFGPARPAVRGFTPRSRVAMTKNRTTRAPSISLRA